MFLRTLSKGSHWFDCSIVPYVIFVFLWFSPRDPSHLLCGGWWVVVGRIFPGGRAVGGGGRILVVGLIFSDGRVVRGGGVYCLRRKKNDRGSNPSGPKLCSE